MRLGVLSTIINLPLKQKVYWSILIVFALIYTIVAIGNHYYFKTFGYDYGLFNHIYWKYSHFQVDNNFFDPPLSNSLQDHFSLTLFFLVPVYWIIGFWLTKTYTLLLIQVVFVIIGAFGTYKWVKLKTKHEWLSIAALFQFLSIQGVFVTFTNDYHDIVLGSCIVPVFLYLLESRQLWKSIICLLFVITSKENMPIIMLVVLFVQLFSDWKETIQRRNIIILAAICTVYSLLLFNWLMPLVADPDRKNWVFKYYHLGNSLKEVFIYLLTHPIEAIRQLFVNHSCDPAFDGIKMEFYWAFFILWGGLFLFLKPKYFIILIPLICQKVYSDIQVMWGVYAYYSIEICCFLVGAVFISISSIKNERILKILMVLILVLNLSYTIHFVTGGCKKPWMSNGAKMRFFSEKFYENNNQEKYYNEFSKIIPDDASICCTQNMSTHFSFREKISVFPNIRDYNYVLIDTLDNYPGDIITLNKKKRELLLSGKWDVLYSKDRFLLLKRIIPTRNK